MNLYMAFVYEFLQKFSDVGFSVLLAVPFLAFVFFLPGCKMLPQDGWSLDAVSGDSERLLDDPGRMDTGPPTAVASTTLVAASTASADS